MHPDLESVFTLGDGKEHIILANICLVYVYIFVCVRVCATEGLVYACVCTYIVSRNLKLNVKHLMKYLCGSHMFVNSLKVYLENL